MKPGIALWRKSIDDDIFSTKPAGGACQPVTAQTVQRAILTRQPVERLRQRRIRLFKCCSVDVRQQRSSARASEQKDAHWHHHSGGACDRPGSQHISRGRSSGEEPARQRVAADRRLMRHAQNEQMPRIHGGESANVNDASRPPNDLGRPRPASRRSGENLDPMMSVAASRCSGISAAQDGRSRCSRITG